MSVLVAHTDQLVRHSVREVLERLGHEVLEAPPSGEALELCRTHRPDVLLLELAPERNGTNLLDAVKRDIDLFRTGVVVIGRDLDVEGVRSVLHRGAHDVLREPIDVAELGARVQAAERTKILQEELAFQSERLEKFTYGDELTGLLNRRFLLVQTRALVSGAERHGRPMSVLMIDADHFKDVNDTYGHAAGDTVLTAVAGALRERLRKEDWVGRFGGEEFLALLPDDDRRGAAVVAEALRGAVAALEVRVEEMTVPVTVSIGAATRLSGEGCDELLRRADEALYAAKRAGRNRVHAAASLRDRI